MAKKKKSKSKSKSAAAGASARPDAAQEFPHDAFDAAFRRYVHPAAVADLNRLAPGGPDWKRFLEAFGNSIFDLSAQIHQTQACQPSFDQEQRFMEMLGIRLDMNCPIASAIRRWKGEQGLSALKFPSVYRTIIHGAMPSYGRPSPQKLTTYWRMKHRCSKCWNLTCIVDRMILCCVLPPAVIGKKSV